MKYTRYSLFALILCFGFAFTLCSCSDSSDFIDEFINYPNPFEASSEYTTFKVKINSSANIKKATVNVYSANGDLLVNLNMDVAAKEADIEWHGVDKNGKYLPSTVYYAEVSVENEEGNISKASTKTLIK